MVAILLTVSQASDEEHRYKQYIMDRERGGRERKGEGPSET